MGAIDDVISRLREEGLARLALIASAADLEPARVALFGRKSPLTLALRGLRDLPADERPAAGDALNRLKDELSALIEARAGGLDQGPVTGGRVDLTLPGRAPVGTGALHPLRGVLEEICDIFYSLGFVRAEGPDVELDYYNFTALNFPDDHPARDSQDTFYLNDAVCLRTQTSPAQVRIMERTPPPLACIVPGRVYRNEANDASHASEFYQVEGFCVDRDVSLADLRATVQQFVLRFFGGERAIRFRPHFFPFTEPSVEVDMTCAACGGSGCGVCGRTGWLEIMGAGMIHPSVFAAAGYPVDGFTGYAFGLGIDRITMLRYGIDDIRLLYENDLRFLTQFRGAR